MTTVEEHIPRDKYEEAEKQLWMAFVQDAFDFDNAYYKLAPERNAPIRLVNKKVK